MKQIPRQKQKMSRRLYLITGVAAAGLIIAFTVFLNISQSGDAEAKSTTTMQSSGFEDAATWSATGSGTWTINSSPSNARTGSYSARLAISSSSDGIYRGNGNKLKTPASGTNYITIIAHAKASGNNNQCAVGLAEGTNISKSPSPVTVSTSSYGRISYTFLATNNKDYAPYLYGKSTNGSSVNIYFDDVVVYISSSATADIEGPSKPQGISANTSGSQLVLSWAAGTDDLTGAGGTLILRKAGLVRGTPIVNSQALYNPTSSSEGPTSISGWTVIKNDTNLSSYSDAPGSNNSYTYLVYMRDMAYNYSAPARILTFFGNNLTASIDGLFAADGLYIPSGNTLTIPNGDSLLLGSNANITIYGTLHVTGNFATTANLTFASGSTFKFGRDGKSGSTTLSIPEATWEDGSTLLFTGLFRNLPAGLDQDFSNVTFSNILQIADINLPDINARGNFNITNTGPFSKKILIDGELRVGKDFNQTGGIFGYTGTHAMITFTGTGTAGNLNITGGANSAIAGLKIDNSSGVTLNDTITVNSLLHLKSGAVILGSNQLIIASGASIHVEGGTINGTPSFSGTVDLTYYSPATTGNELPSSSSALRNLAINTAGTVTLNKDVVVNNSLILTRGKLELGTRNLTVNIPGNISGASDSGYVVTNGTGALKIKGLGTGGTTAAVLFPVGFNSSAYNPVQVKNTGTLDDFIVRLTNEVYDNYSGGTATGSIISDHVIDKTWHIDENTAGGSTVTVTLLWSAAQETNNFDRSNCGLGHFTGGAWDSPQSMASASYDAGSELYSVSRSGISTFSPFGVGDDVSPLPVKMVSINASKKENIVNVSWVTSTEINNEYFAVERSANGKDFEEVGRVKGQGNTNKLTSYNFKDEKLPDMSEGRLFYRIRQFDFDGKSELFPIVSVDMLSNDPRIETMYPNPFTDNVNISFFLTLPGDVMITINDINGRTVYSDRISGSKGENTYSYRDNVNLPKGIYFFNLMHDQKMVTKKIMKTI